jgi:hypothetical protein
MNLNDWLMALPWWLPPLLALGLGLMALAPLGEQVLRRYRSGWTECAEVARRAKQRFFALAGVEAICPVDASVSHPVSSPQRTVDGLIAVYEASRAAYGGRPAMNQPALNITVAEMLAALEQVAGPAVRARVRFERDERIAGIVANWPTGARADRAAALGLQPEQQFADIIRKDAPTWAKVIKEAGVTLD